jgi:hypothetical protein
LVLDFGNGCPGYQEQENPRGALAALAAGVDISIFGNAANLNYHWEGMCFGKDKEFLKMPTPMAGFMGSCLMEKKLEFSAAADYENEALAIEAPESQRTPILLANFLKLVSLPAATWNLDPK